MPWKEVCSSVLSGVRGAGQRGGADLGIHATVRHLGEVDGDEVVGVGLGLRAGQQLLPGILRHRRDHRRSDLGAGLGVSERRGRREVDLLLRQLVVDVGVHEAVTPGEQTAGDQQYDHDDYAAGAGELVEYFA